MFGRRTSAYRVSAIGEGQTAHTECAMTISFVEEARCDEHDRIRLTIANASSEHREGLTKIVDVYRESDFVVVPRFLPKGLDAEAWGVKPRALEVTFHEQCYAPISVADSTKALTKAILGAAQVSYHLGIIHRDVSATNFMIASDGKGVLIDYDAAVFTEGPEGEAERRKQVGSFPFRARELVEDHPEETKFLHQPWHDIEPLVYSIVFVLFIHPTGPDGPIGMSPEVERIWYEWNQEFFAVESKEYLLLKSSGLEYTLAPFTGFWKEAPELVGTVAKYCGLGLEHSWIDRVGESAILGAKWVTGELSHDGLVGDLGALLRRQCNETNKEQMGREVSPATAHKL
ncbi:hypothetical protein MVLG_02061 [Microbotryum lychnidis-dioicae p1A1 Lamole]|uniref:Protein kinase domain-containing protein n=1 Tax=Microbotryum lychnidis-dioicae (strain p1A1 Lamole / MvSl-1064) TaxID=683840 RepID=U5H410_USTV1|nr:hypothetical protein MVLG_02061 [Microbotryum lychnidis-dioicae p1A1 Lamole]|eukprot:KDE07595.1 hypothetical protein MVLG_02061 [Microbotryum lychnidis-dioicae p1A1 Lamole]